MNEFDLYFPRIASLEKVLYVTAVAIGIIGAVLTFVGFITVAAQDSEGAAFVGLGVLLYGGAITFFSVLSMLISYAVVGYIRRRLSA